METFVIFTRQFFKWEIRRHTFTLSFLQIHLAGLFSFNWKRKYISRRIISLFKGAAN